jgi:hypothetical protein
VVPVREKPLAMQLKVIDWLEGPFPEQAPKVTQALAPVRLNGMVREAMICAMIVNAELKLNDGFGFGPGPGEGIGPGGGL